MTSQTSITKNRTGKMKRGTGKKILLSGIEKKKDSIKIFKNVEKIRHDLTNCAKLLFDISHFLDFPFFQNSDYSFKVIYGTGREAIKANSLKSSNTLILRNDGNKSFNRGKSVLIYNEDTELYQLNRIKSVDENRLILDENLTDDFPESSGIIVLKEVEYKYYPDQNALKRKVNNGCFLRFFEEVTDFYVKFFPESCSVLYRIELKKTEQIRGYVFLTNMGAKIEKEA